jgi:hypothetical protein
MSVYAFPDITLDGILASREFLLTKESQDKDQVQRIAFLPTEELYPRLVDWAAHAFPPGFAIWSLSIIPPNYCSDGVARPFAAYLDFLCGEEGHMVLVTQLQTRFKDTTLTTSYEGNTITLHISK